MQLNRRQLFAALAATTVASVAAKATIPSVDPVQAAYNRLKAMISPSVSRHEMETAIRTCFGSLPQYGGAFHDCVLLNEWHDLVLGFQGSDPRWADLVA